MLALFRISVNQESEFMTFGERAPVELDEKWRAGGTVNLHPVQTASRRVKDRDPRKVHIPCWDYGLHSFSSRVL